VASTNGRSSATLPLTGGRTSRVTEDVEPGVWKIVLDAIDAADVAALGALPVIERTYESSDDEDTTDVDNRRLFSPPPDGPWAEQGRRAHGS
jgi:hypothetical protein